MNGPAQQGHRYQFVGKSVIAMEYGKLPMVRAIVSLGDGNYTLGELIQGYSAAMRPEPMRYFHGEVPK